MNFGKINFRKYIIQFGEYSCTPINLFMGDSPERPFFVEKIFRFFASYFLQKIVNKIFFLEKRRIPGSRPKCFTYLVKISGQSVEQFFYN